MCKTCVSISTPSPHSSDFHCPLSVTPLDRCAKSMVWLHFLRPYTSPAPKNLTLCLWLRSGSKAMINTLRSGHGFLFCPFLECVVCSASLSEQSPPCSDLQARGDPNMAEPSLLPNQSQEDFLPTSQLPLQVTPTNFSPLPATGMKLTRECRACLSLLSRSLPAVHTVCEPWPLHPVGLPPGALQAHTPRAGAVPAQVLIRARRFLPSSQICKRNDVQGSCERASTFAAVSPSCCRNLYRRRRKSHLSKFARRASSEVCKAFVCEITCFPSPPSSGCRAPTNHLLQVPWTLSRISLQANACPAPSRRTHVLFFTVTHDENRSRKKVRKGCQQGWSVHQEVTVATCHSEITQKKEVQRALVSE